MVGVFTLHNINVLSGNIFTLKNGLAFDLYDVTNPLDPLREEEMWSKVLEDARQAIEDKLPLDELISKKAQMISFEEILSPYHPAQKIRWTMRIRLFHHSGGRRPDPHGLAL